jgi:putative Holliday junction resolvase
MRYLGLDFGEKRIGVAVSDPLGMTAQSHGYVFNDEKTLAAIKVFIEDYQIVGLVLGLPKNREGGDSKKAEHVRIFGKWLVDELALPIEYIDERFSTVAVTRHLIESGVNRKKRKQVVDGQAAAFILQGYLDAKS